MTVVNLFSYHTKSTKEFQAFSEKWMQEIAVYFPPHLEQMLKDSGSIQRKRGVKSGLDFLKILLLYAVSGISFRMLALSAAALSISTISDTAWRKKFLSSLPFLHSLLNNLLQSVFSQSSASKPENQTVYLVDASTIRQDGKQQSQYRIHMCYNLNQNTMSQVKLTDNHTAESLKHYEMKKGDLFLADAGYGTAANFIFAKQKKADVILRVSPNHFPLYDGEGNKIQILPLLAQAHKEGISSFEITGYIRYQKQYQWVRFVIGKLPEEKVEKIRKRKRRRAQKDGFQVREKTLEYAGFVFLATSLGAEYDREEILSIYRNRWQVELLFKRIKQNFKIQTIRAASETYALCLIYLWLIIWMLVERQVIRAERYLKEKELDFERISQWDLCRFYFIRTVKLLELSWSLFLDPKEDIYLLNNYLSVHVSRRKNQNYTFHSDVMDSLIS